MAAVDDGRNSNVVTGWVVFGMDLAMICMILGALCKFIELVVLVHTYQRYYFSITGGFLIALGSGCVAIATLKGSYVGCWLEYFWGCLIYRFPALGGAFASSGGAAPSSASVAT